MQKDAAEEMFIYGLIKDTTPNKALFLWALDVYVQVNRNIFFQRSVHYLQDAWWSWELFQVELD